MSKHINTKFLDNARLSILSGEFRSTGFVRLPQLFEKDCLENVKESILHNEGGWRANSFIMEEYGSPRILKGMGAPQLEQLVPELPQLYASPELRSLLESISGLPVTDCTHPVEYMVANRLTSKGDTHGWHLDDPPLALVWIIRSPPERCGGHVEVVRQELETPSRGVPISRHWFKDGDAYLLRADKHFHRVSPLSGLAGDRVAVNFAFECGQEIEYGPTASRLYG